MPARLNWNGKYVQSGNGGFAGSLAEPRAGMVKTLSRGYASGGTDTGHRGQGANCAAGHPEKIRDFGHRAEHLTAIFANAKDAIMAFCGKPSRRSCFQGCSNGGREGLIEVQRFPADFDGINAGAPAYNFTRLMARFKWNAEVVKPLRGPARRSRRDDRAACGRAPRRLRAARSRRGISPGLRGSPACRSRQCGCVHRFRGETYRHR